MFATSRKTVASIVSSSQKFHYRLESSQAAATRDKFKIVVAGGGTGGLAVASQIYDRFRLAGKPLKDGDIAIIDAAENHHYQPGWTLVGAGLGAKTDFRRRLASLIPKHTTLVPENVHSFSPASSSITTASGREISYEALVVAIGMKTNWDTISGLTQALANPTSGVSSIYSYDTCDKVWADIESLRSGKAVFTQPAGVIKCAGGNYLFFYLDAVSDAGPNQAPQKIMWMAWDRYRRTGRRDHIQVDFFTGMPTMFSVKKYSDSLNTLREERGVGGHFQHNLVAVDSQHHIATFKTADGSTTDVDYTTLHVTPPMGPPDILKGSPISDTTGWVPVDQSTLRHVNPEFGNVFSLGDCSSLPTSKTAAAITAQAPILTENLFSVIDTGKVSSAKYSGYTSCPLLTGYGELMLAEFKYGLVPDETFGWLHDQAKSQRLFYHLKKDVFPAAYWKYMVRGKWFGRAGLRRSGAM